ncbi:DNA polymerase III subunit delta' [Aureimonas populi]|uniref:DNA polymerase III subunit delta n=1 Tax=Aureimonas populi TaxID=1701758 RepID=A0ABW5CNE6_9HYPH|nr:DNA polymerase III subunit delta' [Aureimonas populi]
MIAGHTDAPDQHDDIEGLPTPAMLARIVGHEAAREALDAAARGQRLHHAWLLQGPRGVGKASVAFEFARKLLSTSTSVAWGDIQISQTISRQIAQAGHPNLIHITRPAGERGGFRTQITVEEIRRLNHFFHTTAAEGWRVAMIDPAEDMNRNAANALLKILEEPPERSIFLIVNHMPGRLLPTIRSRCRVLRFDPLSPGEVETALTSAGIDASPEDIRRAAARADGSVRAAAMMLLAGALEVGDEVARLISGRPDWAGIQKLADALVLKGREAAFEAMVGELFHRLAAEAEDALTAGDMARAGRLAALWQDEQARWLEAGAFNLDRKQTLLTFFHKLQAARERDVRAVHAD